MLKYNTQFVFAIQGQWKNNFKHFKIDSGTWHILRCLWKEFCRGKWESIKTKLGLYILTKIDMLWFLLKKKKKHGNWFEQHPMQVNKHNSKIKYWIQRIQGGKVFPNNSRKSLTSFYYQVDFNYLPLQTLFPMNHDLYFSLKSCNWNTIDSSADMRYRVPSAVGKR